MRIRPVLFRASLVSPLVLVAVLLAGCSAENSACDLAGDWTTLPNPGGGSIGLSLGVSSGGITGVGASQGNGPSPVVDSGAVTGQYLSGSGVFALALRLRSGRVRTFAGRLACPDRLEISEADGSASPGFYLLRQSP